MYKCLKCGREFTNNNQEHFCSDRPTTIDEYINDQLESSQPYLHLVRDTIRKVLPDTQEKISWGMPTFWKHHNIIHFAAAKHHIGLYPGADAIVAFSDRLLDYKSSKGAIQFPYNKPLPLDLISEIASWCYDTGIRH